MGKSNHGFGSSRNSQGISQIFLACGTSHRRRDILI